jgi:hypothetical protein
LGRDDPRSINGVGAALLILRMSYVEVRARRHYVIKNNIMSKAASFETPVGAFTDSPS